MHSLQPTLAEIVKREEDLVARIADLASRLRDVREKALSQTRGSGIGKRGESMQAALSGMERHRGALRSKMYAVQQEMLRDVVTNSDVVCVFCCFPLVISVCSLKLFGRRSARHVSRLRVWR